ncbi:sporulation integral membrane protein YtvI [Salsuginibacillus halophilus]|uniref:Sporulation integral membrane protein YtvI n=1 Tax=Salsuginibacillus halophilus TaxID=517424 RepID=A0A2P8HBG8_9BACI|nr:sporulation integral membrane protein YtvI [Salsuginibacillus halophilus]PSL43566.1 sporulation integral membrane protein YtvI [Salsuginibacillus halophilus]
MTKQHAYILLRTAVVIGVSLLAAWLLGILFSISYPFLIGILLAWLLHPLVRTLKYRLHFHPALAAFMGLLTGLSALAAIITALSFLSVYGFQQLSERVPDWIETAADNLQNFFNDTIWPFWQEMTGLLDTLSPEQQATLEEGIAQLGTQLGGIFGQFGQSLADGVTQFALGFPSVFIGFIFTILAVYFLGKDWERLTSLVQRNVPDGLRERAKAFSLALRLRVFGFIRAQIILMMITTVIVLIGLFLLQVEYAFTLAVIVGIAEVIPYLGTGTILIPWFLYLFFTGDITFGLAIAVLYVVALVVRQTLEPKVLSFSLNLHPLGVLISMFTGLQLFGFIGLIIGPIVLVVLVILYDIGIFDDVYSFIKNGWKDEP